MGVQAGQMEDEMRPEQQVGGDEIFLLRMYMVLLSNASSTFPLVWQGWDEVMAVLATMKTETQERLMSG